MPYNKETNYSFVKKVWIVGGIFALIVVVLLLLQETFNFLILIFAGVLIACYFRGISSYLQSKLNWPQALTLTISIVGTFLFITAVSWSIGAKVSSQASQLQESLPETIENVKNSLNNSYLGRQVVQEITEIQHSKEMTSYVSRFFKTTFGFLGDIYIILLIGAFFTAAPELYKKGIIQLVPPAKRDRAKEIVEDLGSGLKKWLAGKLLAMLIVFCLTAVGLAIIGVPFWLTLAILAGLLNFIPNFGPLAAMIPAVLVAFTISPATAGIVAGMYLLIQFLESNIITPKVQQHLIKVPPALIIISQILVGALTGIWGIILATPLVLVLIILIQDLYVDPMNKRK